MNASAVFSMCSVLWIQMMAGMHASHHNCLARNNSQTMQATASESDFGSFSGVACVVRDSSHSSDKRWNIEYCPDSGLDVVTFWCDNACLNNALIICWEQRVGHSAPNNPRLFEAKIRNWRLNMSIPGW